MLYYFAEPSMMYWQLFIPLSLPLNNKTSHSLLGFKKSERFRKHHIKTGFVAELVSVFWEARYIIKMDITPCSFIHRYKSFG
jgi:hypothetical protein